MSSETPTRSGEAVLTDYVEDQQENGTYRLDICGDQLNELWRACEHDNRTIYRLLSELSAANARVAGLQEQADKLVLLWRQIASTSRKTCDLLMDSQHNHAAEEVYRERASAYGDCAHRLAAALAAAQADAKPEGRG